MRVLTPLLFAAIAVAFAAVPASAQTAAAPSFAIAPGSTRCSAPASDSKGGTTLQVEGPGAVPLRAFVVVPQRAQRRAPAVLWVHWLGDPPSDHTEFATDVEALAQHGVISMLVDMPWSQPDWFEKARRPQDDYANTVAQVVALRRALDCLVAMPRVDAARIAYVGHDFGAMDGALLLAVDNRVTHAVLMTPTLSFWEWYLLGEQPADRGAYVAQMSAFDLPGWLSRGMQQATLLQFARRDTYVATATASALRNAVPDRDRTLKLYDAGHDLTIAAAHDDRRAWLLAHLGPSR